MHQYGLVRNNEIVKFVESTDSVKIQKMIASGYLPVSTISLPEYNENTQYIVTTHTIGEENITPVYTIESYDAIFTTGQWCKIEDNAIVIGPGILGKDKWLKTESELNDIGWVKYIDTEPTYNADTQYLTSTKTINPTNVTETYTINSYTTEELATNLTDEKTTILNQINQEVNTYINSYYDTGTQQSFTAIYTQQDTPTSVKDYLDPVLAWIQSVMAYYYTKKGVINACTTISQLKAVTWTFDTFTETKPNITLESLMTPE